MGRGFPRIKKIRENPRPILLSVAAQQQATQSTQVTQTILPEFFSGSIHFSQHAMPITQH
jgi:hypothetical protein